MAEDVERHEAARKALEGLVTDIARKSARPSHKMGVEFDVADPRVARWLTLAIFEGLLTQSARSSSDELLALAEKASEGESRTAPRKRKKDDLRQTLVT